MSKFGGAKPTNAGEEKKEEKKKEGKSMLSKLASFDHKAMSGMTAA